LTVNHLCVGLSCTVIDPALSGGRLDGIGVYTDNIYKRLRARPEEAEIVPVSFLPLLGRAPAPALAGSELFPHSYPVSAALSLATSLPFSSTGLARRGVRLYHATDYRVPKLGHIPVVATLYDAIPLKYPSWANARLRQLKNIILKSAARWADHVIAISRAAVPELVEYYGVREDRISVIHLGLSESWYAPIAEVEREQVLRKHRLRPGYFLFVGTLQPRKNVARILAAYRALPEFLRRERQLVIVGKIGWSADELVTEIRRLESEGACRWLDYTAPEDMGALYQSAGAFVFPSLHEGFGLPVLEAFASCIPVITSKTSSLPEVAGDAAILVDPFNVDEIRGAMLELIENRALADRLIEKGWRRAATMTWDRCASETLAVYRSLTG
jgi:glycosyltransferase involved in cell wall biosynthesis